MNEINKTKIEKEILKITSKYKYTWDNEGKKILLDTNKLTLSEKDKDILEILLIQEIPNELHKNLWLISSGASLLYKEKNENYKNFLKLYENMEKKNHYFYKYLTMKLSHDLYRSNLKGEEEINKLKNILNAFISRNLSINYCQGLNLICAYLLQMTDFNEEESFFLFVKLMEDILPYDYFYFGIGIDAELSLMKILLEKYDNELYNHLDKMQSFCYIQSKLSMWIISLMICKIDQRITNFFFDCIFLFSNNNYENYLSILYTMIFSILTILRNDLLNSDESNDISEILEHFSINPISDENFKKIIYYNLISQEKNKFKNKFIFNLRKSTIKNIFDKSKINFKSEEKTQEISCEDYFPICIKEEDKKPAEEFIIYKGKNDLNNYIIDDYYYKKEKEVNENNNNLLIKDINKINDIDNNNGSYEVKSNNEDEDSIMNNLIIERRKHFCK